MSTSEAVYETHLTEMLFHKAYSSKIPISGTFELTPMCNFNCRMCYIRQSAEDIKKSGKRLRTLDEWKRLADEAVEQGMLYLLLTGGEPLSWPHFWELYEYLGKKGLIISINTNGSLIDEATVERFREHPPSRINITLYGASEDTYKSLCQNKEGFRKTISAIEMLQDAGILVKLNCSLTPYNVQDFEKIVKYAKSRNLLLQANSYMFPPIRKEKCSEDQTGRFKAEEAAFWHLKGYWFQHSEEEYIKFLKKIQKGISEPIGTDENCYDPIDGRVRCRAGSTVFWATWDGAVLPCGMLPEPRIILDERPFAEVWRELRTKTEGIRLSGICGKCKGNALCHVCAAMALAETGTFEKVPRYLCKMVAEMKKQAAEQLKIYGTKDAWI